MASNFMAKSTSIAMAIVGVATGGFFGFVGAEIVRNFGDGAANIPQLSFLSCIVGAVSGFFPCYLFSLWYFKSFNNRSRVNGLFIGPLYSGMAGGSSGLLWGIGYGVLETVLYRSGWSGEAIAISVFFGILVGFGVGIIAGFLISLALALGVFSIKKE
jgi:hypothetical protein